MAPELTYVQGKGFLISTGTAVVFIGKGSVDANIQVDTEKDSIVGEHDGIKVVKKNSGFILSIPNARISYLTKQLHKNEAKSFACDVLLLHLNNYSEHAIVKIKPKLAILNGGVKKEALYKARELQKKTGVQTIAAQEGIHIDLFSYNALAKQKSLLNFTKEKWQDILKGSQK